MRFDETGAAEIYTIAANGDNEGLLLPGLHYGPRVSPDGSTVSFSAELADHRLGTAFVAIDGTGYRELVVPDATLNIGCAAWAPDGARCATEAWDDTDASRTGLYTLRVADGGDIRQLTTSTPDHHDIPGDYSPDGTQIVFARSDINTGVSTLHVINVDGTGERQIADGVFGLGTAWSPDGRSDPGGCGRFVVPDRPRRIRPAAADQFLTRLRCQRPRRSVVP